MTRAGAPVAFEDPDRAVDAIIERVGKNIELALPLGLGKANHVANALFKRAAADPSIKLRIFTALTLEKPRAKGDLERRFLEPIADRVFAGYPELAYARALHARTLPPNVKVDEFFFAAGTRLGIAAAQQSYICANYTHALRYVLDRGVNVVAQLVAKRVRGGETRLSLSCNPDLTLDLLACRARKECDFLFVGQVNSELPFMPGDGDIAESEFDLMLEGPVTDFRLFAPPREPVELADYAAGFHVARTVADGGTLQLGIGSLGDAVAHALILRHRRNADFRALAARLDPADRAATGLRESAVRARPLRRERDACGRLSRFDARGRAQARGRRRAAARGVLPGLARLLPRAAGDAASRARQAAHGRGLLRQRALRRRGGQAPRAGQGALRQQRHDGDLARRRDLGRAGERPGGERRRRAIQFRRAKLCAGRRALDHPAARDAHGQAAHDLEHFVELRPHHDSAPSARHRGDGIRHRRFARQERPRRDRGHARDRRFAFPG